LPAGAATQWRRRAGPGPRACGRALKPLGPEKAGEVAGEAGGFGDEAALEARQAIDEAEAEVARGADQHPVVGEQLVQAVEGGGRDEAVEAAPALVAAERFHAARIEAEAQVV